jgi:hypothetical protein
MLENTEDLRWVAVLLGTGTGQHLARQHARASSAGSPDNG